MSMLTRSAGAVALSAMGGIAAAACGFETDTEIKMLSAGFPAWQAVTAEMAECGNVQAELDQEFREKQPAAFAAEPSLYQLGGVSNGTIVPLLNQGTIRPLDDLVAAHGGHLDGNQLVRIGGEVMAVAMMINTQHLMYRSDIFADLGLDVPTTHAEMLDAAARIEEAGVVEYPLGGAYKTGWNLALEFVNAFIGEGGAFFDDQNRPTIANDTGVAALEILADRTAFMDPEYLTADATYVQQQFQQGKIAMANLWASRADAMNDPDESEVVGKVAMAAAPMGSTHPATTLWWDGIVVARNIPDAEAKAAFRVALEGIDSDMVAENNDTAVWLIDGYTPGPMAEGVAATAEAGARPYPSSARMGLMHSALGTGVADFLTGRKDAQTTLADIEAAYMTAAREGGLVD